MPVGERLAFLCEAVNVRRLIDHHAVVISVDVSIADIVALDDEDVGFLACCARARRRRVLRLAGSGRTEKRSRGNK
jgi:hypothetical protein